MKLAILGTRGVPPAYGGFETFAAELSTRLVRRGHDVTVYCRGESSRGRVDESSRDQVDESSRDQVDESSREAGVGVPHINGGAGLEDSTTRRLDDSKTRRLDDWNGVHRIVLPAIGHKYLETVSHTFLSALDALRRDFDAVLLCNAANAFVLPLLRAARIPVAINVDGIERKRRKWNALGRAVYAIGETFSVAFANRVIADARVIADYYRAHYALDPEVIPYGAEFPEEADSDVLSRLGLRPRQYVLYVSRFEPENNPLEVVEAYEGLSVVGCQLSGGAGLAGETPASDRDRRRRVTLADNRQPSTDNRVRQTASQIDTQPTADHRTAAMPPLVMLGKGLYAAGLVRELHTHASERVLFPGALYGDDYRTLQRHAALYIQATEVGGTHPALIEAMGSGGVVLAHDTPENREVGGDAVGYFRLRPEETLSGMLREWLGNDALREEARVRARKRAGAEYSWERVTESYERLLQTLSRA